MSQLNDKYIISEFHAFDIDKQVIKEAIQNNGTISIKCILQKADTVNRNGRVYPFKILKREVDKYQQLVNERSAMGECVPAGTQIYTPDGWKNIENMSVNDKIFTLNLNTNNIEIQNVERTIKKNYTDDMIHIYNNSSLDMMITKKHKVVLWDRNDKPYILTGEELYNKLQTPNSSINKSHIKHSGNWIGTYSEYFNLPGTDINIKTEDWAAFLGIFISEGHTAGSKGGKISNIVGITQVKSYSKSKIKELLNKLPFEYKELSNERQFIINNEFLYNHLSLLGNSSEKYIPTYAKQWSPTNLSILLEWLLMGDGKNRKDRKGQLIKEYFTISDKLSEDVYEVMLKLGYGATITTVVPKDRIIYDIKTVDKEIELSDGSIELVSEKIKVKRIIKAENSQPLKLIHARTAKGIYLDTRFVKADLVPFNDNVYCVSVPNQTWLMRYNNKVSWTHNCDHPDSAVISLANVSHIVTEMHWEGSTLYGTIEIADTPSGNILKGLLKSGIKLGISSRGVGSVKSSNEKDVVQEDFELIAFDIVSSPSTPGAYLFKENRQWGMKKLTNEDLKPIKTEESIALQNEIYNNIIKLSEDKFWENSK